MILADYSNNIRWLRHNINTLVNIESSRSIYLIYIFDTKNCSTFKNITNVLSISVGIYMFWNKAQPAQYKSINQVINISKRTVHLSLHVRIRKKWAGKGFLCYVK